ncbi:MAG: ABC transporter permease [Defluviitaleaceae bacterium]|nr:ABC transporter permease [Defluviitaleaceae bacterium]
MSNFGKKIKGSAAYGYWQPISLVMGVLLAWQVSTAGGMVDAFILPSPMSVIRAFGGDFELLMRHSAYTLSEAFVGLAISLSAAFLAAVGMDRFLYWRKALYPLLVISQAVPYIAIAPLLVLWLGHGMAPRVALVSLTCFFPLVIGLYDGIRQIRQEYLDELQVMGGSYFAGLFFVKLPLGRPTFFSGLKIAATYSFVGAVIAGWVGGTTGLGVYMTRVRRSFEFDKMFAVILLIVIISLLLMYVVKFLEKRMTRDVI